MKSLPLSLYVCYSCLLYKHLAMDGFSSVLGLQGRLTTQRGRSRKQAVEQRPTSDHPYMAALGGRQVQYSRDHNMVCKLGFIKQVHDSCSKVLNKTMKLDKVLKFVD